LALAAEAMAAAKVAAPFSYPFGCLARMLPGPPSTQW
jgi:hypothetical protein